MDLLHSRYASPMDFMKTYIEQGRFEEFVTEILEMENKRKIEKEEKENDDRLWIAFVHSKSDLTFIEWKEQLFAEGETQPETLSMTDTQVEETLQNARGILRNFSPS